MKISAGAACYDDCGNPIPVIQFSDTVDKRCDRFHIAMNNTLHQLISYHEISSAGILIYEK